MSLQKVMQQQMAAAGAGSSGDAVDDKKDDIPDLEGTFEDAAKVEDVEVD